MYGGAGTDFRSLYDQAAMQGGYGGGQSMGIGDMFGMDPSAFLNQQMVQNGQDPFGLQNRSNEQLSSILDMIQKQISNPQQQGSLVELLRKSREEAGIPGLQQTLAQIQSQIAGRNDAYRQGANKIEGQPIAMPLLIGQNAALERQRNAEISGLNDQAGLAQQGLSQGNDYAGQLFGAYRGDMEAQNQRPQTLIDLARQAFGLQQMQGDIANQPLERQLKQVQLQQAIREGQAAGYKFEQVGDTLVRIDPRTGQATPVFTGGKDSQGQVQLSASQQTDFADMNTLLQQLQQLQGSSLSGVGPLTGRLSGISDALGLSGQNAQATRAMIGNIRGTINKLRAGTSLTESELKQLNSYVPSENDTPQLLMTKANALTQYIQMKQQNLLSVAGGNYSSGGGGGDFSW